MANIYGQVIDHGEKTFEFIREKVLEGRDQRRNGFIVHDLKDFTEVGGDGKVTKTFEVSYEFEGVAGISNFTLRLSRFRSWQHNNQEITMIEVLDQLRGGALVVLPLRAPFVLQYLDEFFDTWFFELGRTASYRLWRYELCEEYLHNFIRDKEEVARSVSSRRFLDYS